MMFITPMNECSKKNFDKPKFENSQKGIIKMARILHKVFLLILSISVIYGCASQMQGESQTKQALSLDVSHFRRTIKIKDGPLENLVVFSTQSGFQEKRGLLGIVWNDQFIRGFLEKKSGKKYYQVYVYLMHQSKGWLYPYQANFGKPLMTARTKSIDSDVSCSGSRYSGCTYVEQFGFVVPERELRRIQNNATPNDMKNKAWVFKVKTKSGRDYRGIIFLAEIIALLETMDAYRPIQTQ